MDAFYVAYRIPNLMRDLFAEGVMSAAFVPAFTRRLTVEGRDAAWRLGTQLINALIVITGGLVLAGIIFAEPLTRLFAGSFAEVPGKLELTVEMTRVMLPFLILVAVAAACMGMLNSRPTVLHAGAVTCDVQRQSHLERRGAGAAHAASWVRADHGDRVRRGAGRRGPDRHPVLGAATVRGSGIG